MIERSPIDRFSNQGLVRAGTVPNQGLVPTGPSLNGTDGTAWTTPYVDGTGSVQELALGAAATYLRSAGAAAAPTFAVIAPAELTGGTWKVVYTNGSGVVTELALGASGKVLTSNGASSAPTFETPSAGTTSVRAYATGDQSVTNDATLTNSTYLSLTLTAGKTYFIQGFLYMVAATGGYKFDFGGGAATATNFIVGALDHPDAGTALDNTSLMTTLTTVNNKNTAATYDVRFAGSIEVNGGGTLILRFAQQTATPANSNTVKQGSWLMATLLS